MVEIPQRKFGWPPVESTSFKLSPEWRPTTMLVMDDDGRTVQTAIACPPLLRSGDLLTLTWTITMS